MSKACRSVVSFGILLATVAQAQAAIECRLYPLGSSRYELSDECITLISDKITKRVNDNLNLDERLTEKTKTYIESPEFKTTVKDTTSRTLNDLLPGMFSAELDKPSYRNELSTVISKEILPELMLAELKSDRYKSELNAILTKQLPVLFAQELAKPKYQEERTAILKQEIPPLVQKQADSDAFKTTVAAFVDKQVSELVTKKLNDDNFQKTVSSYISEKVPGLVESEIKDKQEIKDLIIKHSKDYIVAYFADDKLKNNIRDTINDLAPDIIKNISSDIIRKTGKDELKKTIEESVAQEIDKNITEIFNKAGFNTKVQSIVEGTLRAIDLSGPLYRKFIGQIESIVSESLNKAEFPTKLIIQAADYAAGTQAIMIKYKSRGNVIEEHSSIAKSLRVDLQTTDVPGSNIDAIEITIAGKTFNLNRYRSGAADEPYGHVECNNSRDFSACKYVKKVSANRIVIFQPNIATSCPEQIGQRFDGMLKDINDAGKYKCYYTGDNFTKGYVITFSKDDISLEKQTLPNRYFDVPGKEGKYYRLENGKPTMQTYVMFNLIAGVGNNSWGNYRYYFENVSRDKYLETKLCKSQSTRDCPFTLY